MGKVRGLLDRWAEWRSIRLEGKGFRIPDVTHRWRMNGIGGFEIAGTGICWERSTQPFDDQSSMEDFGLVFLRLPVDEQTLILVSHFSEEKEWRRLIRSWRTSRRNLELRLRIAWLRLAKECILKDLL